MRPTGDLGVADGHATFGPGNELADGLHKGSGNDINGTGPDQLDLAAQSGERLLVPGFKAQ